MTKAQILAAIATKFTAVLPRPILETTYGDNVKYYRVQVFDATGTIGTYMQIPIYVVDEGLSEEVAYWVNSEPKPAPVVTIDQQLQNYINGKVLDGTILYADIESVNMVTQKATVTVVTTSLTTVRMLVDKDAGGNLRTRVITG